MRAIKSCLALFCVWLWVNHPAQAAAPVPTPYGVLPDGRVVTQYTLINRRGAQVSVLDYGGIITAIRVPDRHGQLANVVVQRRDLNAYLNMPNFSALLGRVANRISGGGFELNGQRVHLTEAVDGVLLHGGAHGFGRTLWQADTDQRLSASRLTLTHISPDGEGGFPGELRTTVTFTLDDDNSLTLSYQAQSSRDTVINLSHHAFFNLAGDNQRSAEDQCLQIFADRYLSGNQATDQLLSVAGTAWDFREPSVLGVRMRSLGRAFDHNLALQKPLGEMGTAVRA